MIDKSGQGSGEPAQSGYSISPSDSSYLPIAPRAIYIGVGGNLAVLTFSAEIIVFVAVNSGSILPIRPVKVYNTGTTAGALVALY